ncbi:acyl-CoA dehydrogenase family protein [Nocardiopsis tropica]|uniref:Acyl-CoA dehydrogenase family protein n=1 Tax=Nocardiopsis tropica TaxID=109330 RepID=A0ABU7KIH7_9ACTN|nr:acyl-CoA dehydrogenase family protein [Nocardiopsis umidischolae]MEE2049100.1 acyl-CoA dehydrogenase family protein [Nocardiopsis umidischolae]
MAGRFAAGAGSTAADRTLPTARGPRGCPTGYGTGRIVLDLRVHRTLEGTNETMNPIIARGLTGAA